MYLPFKIDLSGKNVVVTGGGGVLCSAFSKALAACGASVAVIDINKAAAEAVASEICQSGGKAIGLQANCLDRASLEEARKIVEKELGTCDILINGAGGNNPKGTTDNEQLKPGDLDIEGLKNFFDLDPEGIRFVFDLNVIATLLTTQIFAKGMMGRDAVILNISSMNAFSPLTKIPAYSAAKAAVSNLTQWLAVHFAPSGIRVNAIAPGFFATNQNRNLLFTPEGTLTDRSRKILSHTPMARFGETEDLIGTLLWLVDNGASGFVTGAIIPVDGGFSAYSGV